MRRRAHMRGFPDLGGGGDGAGFDPEDAFVPEHLPEPGPFLADHEVLVDEDHVAVHAIARGCFEERGVYDMTFGYNLARLNRDRRHPGAGYRYAVDDDDPSVLRVEFTPTTPFCPQSDTLAVGSFRAWNGLPERHDFDLVRIRVAPMHHASEAIADRLERLEERFHETGSLRPIAGPDRTGGGGPTSGGSGGFDGIDHGDPAEDARF